MIMFIKKNADNSIVAATDSEKLANELGCDEKTENQIVEAWNNKMYVKGEEPPPPPVSKNYSVPDLFFWMRGYDEAHPDAKKGQAVADFLDSQNLYTIAVTTRVVSEENELFAPTIAAIKEAVGFTDDEVEEALAYAETKASPDAAS